MHEHDKHAGHSVEMFRGKFWLSLVLAVPVLVYSDSIQRWLHFTPPQFSGSTYVPLIFSTILFFYGGLVFIKAAVSELKGRVPGMMTLISLAIIVAYVYSVATVFVLDGSGFFWELATLIVVMLLGHWMEMRSVMQAESALDAIAKLLPDKALRLVNNDPEEVLVSELKIGDMVLVKPGSNVPVDGVVVKGESSVNEAAITGESKPVGKQAGDEVIAGTINQDGSLTIKVSKLGDDTMLAGVMRLVKEAQTAKSNVQVLADRTAFVLTIVALLSGLVTFVVWLILQNGAFALERSVTVLVIACPHALGLAIPLVVAISTALSARHGLLVRKRLALESARKLDWVLFDKTGTLTKGEFGVTDVLVTRGYNSNDVIGIAASLEQNSEHIIGKGIVDYAKSKNAKISTVENFSALPGLGVQGNVNSKKYLIISRHYLEEKKIGVPREIEASITKAAKQGKTEAYVLENNQVIAAIALADIVRDESRRAIKSLKQLGIKTAMVTGDSSQVAEYVSKQLGLDEFFAQVRPADKAAKVKSLQVGGKSVAFVGDGINDAPALAQATIGMAIGAGTDVAIKSADIILVKSDPMDVIKTINLSKATYRKMIQNLVWATGYNVVAIPLAAGVLYSQGIVLAPAVGAALMSLSTVIVALNAQLLRKVKL